MGLKHPYTTLKDFIQLYFFANKTQTGVHNLTMNKKRTPNNRPGLHIVGKS